MFRSTYLPVSEQAIIFPANGKWVRICVPINANMYTFAAGQIWGCAFRVTGAIRVYEEAQS